MDGNNQEARACRFAEADRDSIGKRRKRRCGLGLAMSEVGRAAWTNLTDSQLLAKCEVDIYRASGPGGQKRNKTSSAVRIRHLPSGLIVIAEESRSQHENRGRALRRLRQALSLRLREEPAREGLTERPELQAVKN